MPAHAADPPFYRSIEAEASLEADGSISLIERELIENPNAAPAVLKRRYWTDADEKVSVVSIVPQSQYKFQPWGQLELTVPPGVTNYTVTTRVTGAVTPVWAVPRGVRSNDPNDFITDPRDRIREILPIWRDAGPHPRSRYVFDYQYFYPTQHETYVVNPSISFGKEWQPVHAIKAGTIGTQIKSAEGDSFRIRHLFDYQLAGSPSSIDLRKYGMRIGGILLFPIAALLIWLAYYAWISLRGRSTSAEIDDRWLRDNIFNQPPEVVHARWTGSIQAPAIENVLRRMERAGKISLDIQRVNENTDDEEDVVTIRLRVDRSRLSDFERTVINSLMPNSDEITSKEVEEAHAKEDFDPNDIAQEWLENKLPAKKRAAKAPLPSRVVTALLFVSGAVLLFIDLPRSGAQFPVALVITLVVTNVLGALWPSIGNPRTALIADIIPFLLLAGVIVVVHTITLQPAGEFASLGATLMTLGGFHGIVCSVLKGDARPPELAAAYQWFRAQPNVREEWIPYLEALGLRQPQTSNEEWGYAFCTYADD